MQSNISSLGENWIQTFSEFRLNHDLFFDKRKLTREAFCLDILKDVYLERIDVQCRIHVLLLLQEHSLYLIRELILLEQVYGSLKNLLNVFKNNNENRFFRSQILICISTILLSSDLEPGVEELIGNFKNLLLNTIYNESEDFVVISAACKCLEEIECCLPNTLESEIENIFSSCENHLSPAFQNYATLLSLCINNWCQKYEKESENGSLKFINSKDGIQLSHIVSSLMELITLMSPMSVYRILSNLISIVKQSEDVSPVVFKLFLPNLIFSSEVAYFNLAFDLLENFHLSLFSPQEELYLLRQLFLLSSHPCLTSSHRMLFLDWLKSDHLIKLLASKPYPLLKPLLPGPFDGPITQEKKCCVLALYVPKTVNKDVGLDFLNESLSGLKKCALLPQKSKAVASFFRTLFTFYSLHNSELMCEYIYKLLLEIMKTSPHLLHYALSFLDAIKLEFPESSFPKDVLTHMVNHILSLRMKQFTNNLECYLDILEQASEICGSEYKPRSVLRLLQNLFCESSSNEINVWEFGNNILSVCRSILLFHNVQHFYYDLAEILCLISQNCDDAEVEYRAKIYYNEMISLSKSKLQSIFKIQTPKKDLQCTLTTFVPGVNSNIQFSPRIQILTKPVLELVRVKKNCTNSDKDNSMNTNTNIDILHIYKEHLDTYDAEVLIPFVLKYISESERNFDKMYGVVIRTKSYPPCKRISVIEIPVHNCSSSASEDSVLYIQIVPCESQPMELHFEIEFTSGGGQSFICYPDPVFLNFKDFFLPLPIPYCLKEHDYSWKKILFENLWEEFSNEVLPKSVDNRHGKSATCLKIVKEEFLEIIEEHWKEFVVFKIDEFKQWIAIFLPPKNHLLMKVDMINEKPFINFVIDDLSLFPWIALYLQKLKKT